MQGGAEIGTMPCGGGAWRMDGSVTSAVASMCGVESRRGREEGGDLTHSHRAQPTRMSARLDACRRPVVGRVVRALAGDFVTEHLRGFRRVRSSIGRLTGWRGRSATRAASGASRGRAGRRSRNTRGRGEVQRCYTADHAWVITRSRWCSWSSRQPNMLKVLGSNPGRDNFGDALATS